MNLLELSATFQSEENVLKLLQEAGIVHKVRKCNNGHFMKLYYVNGVTPRWRCHRKECRFAEAAQQTDDWKFRLLAEDDPEFERYTISYEGYAWRNITPYMATLFNNRIICTCTLLSYDFCLTSAECFEWDKDISKMILVGGSTNFTRHDPRSQIRAVKTFIQHENFTPGGKIGTDDIAVVQLRTPLLENFRIKLANLPLTFLINRDYTTLLTRFRMQMTGSGEDYGIPARIVMLLLRKFGCRCANLSKDSIVIYNQDRYVISRIICFYYYSIRTNHVETPCKDTEGAPVMMDDTLIATQTMSMYVTKCKKDKDGSLPRSPCIDDSSQAAYLQTFSYRRWILENIPEPKPMPRPKLVTIHESFTLKPILPLILSIALYFTMITVVLICNRAILPKIRI